jgi:hypothetical protein
MAITAIGWDGYGSNGKGYDLHVLAGETTPPLNDRLVFQRKDAGGNLTNHFASTKSIPPDWATKPADVDVEFFGEFKLAAAGPQPAGGRRGYGVEVDTTTGTIKVDEAPLAARRLYNFLIRADVKDTADNSTPLSIRISIRQGIRNNAHPCSRACISKMRPLRTTRSSSRPCLKAPATLICPISKRWQPY